MGFVTSISFALRNTEQKQAYPLSEQINLYRLDRRTLPAIDDYFPTNVSDVILVQFS